MVGMLLVLVAAVGATSAFAVQPPDQLAEQGWVCGLTPPTVTPTRIVCGRPGLGRPFPGDPDPRPTYQLLLFTTDAEFLGHVHFIRADLYAGQPCHGGNPYGYRPLIGYYECLNTFGD
jgi:hypothetical protein